MSDPVVSIIMPMLNARDYVGAAIASVLDQRDVPLEIVVVDDGSTDDSVACVKSVRDARVRLVATGGHRGVAHAFNVGLDLARGEYLARCDADDLYVPDRLKRQLGWLQNHLDFGAVCGGFSTITSSGAFICDLQCGDSAQEITGELMTGNTRTSFCTWLVRTAIVKGTGGCREFFRLAEDIDLQLRLAGQCRIWFDPSACYQYRLHDASATHSSNDVLRKFYDATARSFAHQRQLQGADDLERGQQPRPPDVKSTRGNGSRQHVQELLLGVAWEKMFQGHRVKALKTGLRACLLYPTNLDAWKNFGALAIRVQKT